MAGDHLVEVDFTDRSFSIPAYLPRNKGKRTLREVRLRRRQQSLPERAG